MVVVPSDKAVTLPDASTEATDEAVLLQVPPVAPSVKPIVEPLHIEPVPDIVPASGNGLTVNVCVAATVPQPFVTV